MFTIKQEGNCVKIEVLSSIRWSITFRHSRNEELDAILLRNQLQTDLSNKIEQIRREAYELGWKDAKSKKIAKRTWFNGNINSDYVW